MGEKNLYVELSKDLNQHPPAFALQPGAYLYIHSYINSWMVEAICFHLMRSIVSALFSSQIFLIFVTIAILFLFDNYCLIMD